MNNDVTINGQVTIKIKQIKERRLYNGKCFRFY